MNDDRHTTLTKHKSTLILQNFTHCFPFSSIYTYIAAAFVFKGFEYFYNTIYSFPFSSLQILAMFAPFIKLLTKIFCFVLLYTCIYCWTYENL